MTVIGLTGGIASGKTSVANYLAQLGAKILDADIIAREVVAQGSPALKEIAHTFGPGVLHADGTLNRKKLASIVFDNSEALEKLNAIMHPKISKIVADEIAWHKQTGEQKMLLLVAPLLIEVGLHKQVDQVWLVHVNPQTQIDRLIKRDKLSKEEALKRINSQLPESERLKFAHEVIDNNGSWENTRKQVLKLWNLYATGDTDKKN
ncbi:dephospho-CoA kinase [Desulfofalx alkaliphila]|uniref:dephospho-CoA kinase n=1 Tax=Desulfofalx alkaliphila TaxID=105483 RepID=UPI00068BBA08|nr:dephospho-CoA kinase [Desulfofalx alkaliphila]